MTTDNLKLTPIQDLLDKKFFIPSYQRGYRWKEQNVTDLLDDIWEFIQKPEKGRDEFYCLQPIVVKEGQDGQYEVIDGQQRLTTIFMIIHYANEMWVGKQKVQEFQIEYGTRKGSFEFLKDLKIDENSIKIDDSNIDYHHMSKAYQAIHKWVEKKGKDLDNNDFQSKFKHHTKVIWYEIQNDEIDVFTRLNMGKIPLTSAELIKSLFLNSKNFRDNEKNIKQIEIAKEWDDIEQTLQNDEFWYFLTAEKPYQSRIELIFEIFSGQKKTENDELAVYRWFQGKKDEGIVKLWSEDTNNIKKVFLTLKHWFEDRKLYHLIGFLITIGSDVKTIYEEARQRTKTEFKSWLYNQIEIEEIRESDYPNNREKIEKILLLFNIATLLNEKSSHLRFAFDRFRQENWSLEHIHPQADSKIKDKIGWLKEAKEQIGLIPAEEFKKRFEKLKDEEKPTKESILKEIESLLKSEQIDDKNETEFNELKDKIFNLFGAESSDGIENLTLLTGKNNSSLSNALFPTKRKRIIEKDQNGAFIPIYTKNVFLKYYSPDDRNLYFWSEKNRQDYLESMSDTLNKFLNSKGEN